MDFKPGYTPQLEEFRSEVVRVRFLDSVPPDGVRHALAQRGWLAAAEPGRRSVGLALPTVHEIVVAEELAARGLTEILEPTSAILRRVIHGYGSPDQAEQFIPLLAGGNASVWSLRGDNPYDLDPASLTITAIRDGDDYILEGHGDFVGQGAAPGLIWAWATMEGAGGDVPLRIPGPGDAEGVHVTGEIKSIGPQARRVEFRQVRVPIYSALGGEDTAWDVALYALDSRPQAGPLKSSVEMEDLLTYATDTERNGTILVLEPVQQLILMDAFIESHVAQLMHQRNRWMQSAGKEMTYHSAQADLMESRARASRHKRHRPSGWPIRATRLRRPPGVTAAGDPQR